MDRVKLAIALLAGEQADLGLEGTCKILFENNALLKTCYDIFKGDEDNSVLEEVQALVKAGYPPIEVVKAYWDDDDNDEKEVIEAAADVGLPLSALIVIIKEGDEDEEQEEQDDEIDDDTVNAVASAYDITEASGMELFLQLKGLYDDPANLDDYLRTQEFPLEKRIRIMAKVLGII
jgi:hypothetical protein